MLKTQINNTPDNQNINRSNVISFLDFKHRKEHQGLDDIEEYLRKAEILDKLLKYEEALEAYDKAIELNSQCTEAYLGKWYILEEQEKNAEALEVYIKTEELKIPNTDSYIHFQSGNALDNLKRYEEAIQAFDKAIELKPDDAVAYYNKGNALNILERYEEAIVAYDKAIDLDPDYAEAYS
ncbi:tetratricopeptide repeat protein [Rickettsia sp. TH2014]|uniref:tetratricopeptide repeat protein n=1 Tax=Rickettsia sp. TH2014 TaxID=1967503 RepID=UPI001C45818D|nr:tetratricopeptide repeat protein [Rickettsia sp. TH2014]